MADSLTYAGVISNVLSSPIVSSILSILAPTFLGYEDLLTKIALVIVGIVIYGILPFTPTLIRIARREKDIYVSKIEERPRSFIIGISDYIITFFIFTTLGLFYYAIFSLTSLIVAALTFAITLRWKVSIHLIGFCTPLTILTIISKGIFLPIFALAPVLMWARVKTQAHNWTQVVVGTFLGIAVTYYSMTWLIQIFNI